MKQVSARRELRGEAFPVQSEMRTNQQCLVFRKFEETTKIEWLQDARVRNEEAMSPGTHRLDSSPTLTTGRSFPRFSAVLFR
jgi:hypothetical protein